MKFIKSTLLLLLSLCAFISFAEQTATISQQELLTLMATPASNTIVLDVRTPSEFAQEAEFELLAAKFDGFNDGWGIEA